LLSLVPALYMNDFQELKTIGEMSFTAKVKGVYNDNRMPAFDFKLLADKALFKYPDLPRSAENISIDLQISNPGGDIDYTEIWLKKFHIDLGGNPIDMVFRIKNPVSDMHINGQVDAKLDFAGLNDIVPLENFLMKGNLDFSLKILGQLSAIEEERYTDFAVAGNMVLSGFEMNSPALPVPLEISKAEMSFSPASIELKNFDAKMSSSDFMLSGKIENYISYIFNDEILVGKLDLKSMQINLNELMIDEESTEITEDGSMPLKVVEIPTNIDFTFTAAISKVMYDKLLIDQMNGIIRMKNGRLSMDKLGMDMLGGNMMLSGYYDSRDISAPEVDFQMDISEIAIDKSYEAFQIVEKLAPLAKHCRGDISANIQLKSLLDNEMNPVMSSVNSIGSFSSKKISIANSNIFNTIGNKLKIDKLREPGLKDFKASFEMKDGILELKPFDTKIAGQKATISGNQGIDRSINYKMDLDVPAAKFAGSLKKAFPGDIANLTGDIVKVNVLFTGTLDDPKVGVGLGSDNKSIADAAKDKAKEEAAKKIEEGKEKVNEELQKKKDKILKDAQQKADAVKDAARKSAKKIRDEADKKADELINAAKNKSFLEKNIAKTAADKLRIEADKKAKKLVAEADKKADDIMKKAREEADKLEV
ncbi:MAG: AsmA-like C-terminal region-containing protein, partial [Bacteroidota bacterium]|nr:AsmA-like C-terminal region-containing protein [Bacteroidota bacterium]